MDIVNMAIIGFFAIVGVIGTLQAVRKRETYNIWISAGFTLVLLLMLMGIKITTLEISPALAGLGLMLWLYGLVISIYSSSYLGKHGRSRSHAREPEELVDTGIYSVVRHPVYLFGLLMFLGMVFMFFSWLAIAGYVIVLVTWLMGTRLEDRFNLEKYGDDYREYMGRVPRFNLVAGLHRRRILGQTFLWGVGSFLGLMGALGMIFSSLIPMKLPKGLDFEIIFEGEMRFFVDEQGYPLLDPTSGEVVSDEQAVLAPIIMSRAYRSIDSQYAGDVAVLEEDVVWELDMERVEEAGLTDQEQRLYAESLRHSGAVNIYCIDRTHFYNVPPPESLPEEDRARSDRATGFERNYLLMVDPGDESQTVDFFMDEIWDTYPALRCEEVDVEGVSGVVYEGSFEGREMPVRPYGLAESLPGERLVRTYEMLGVELSEAQRELLNSMQEVPLVYQMNEYWRVAYQSDLGGVLKLYEKMDEIEATIEVEGVPELHTLIMRNTYRQEPANFRELLDDTKKGVQLLNLITFWIPLGMLLLGLIMLVPGLMLASRKKERK